MYKDMSFSLHLAVGVLTIYMDIVVYQVTVGKHPDCTCPDFQKGNLCKHYLFVMLRVLRLDQTDPLVWQKALLKSEVRSASAERVEQCIMAVVSQILGICICSLYPSTGMEPQTCIGKPAQSAALKHLCCHIAAG